MTEVTGYIEVMPDGLGKGSAVLAVVDHFSDRGWFPDFVMYCGDDSSDEPAFEAVNSRFGEAAGDGDGGCFTCTVGKKPSEAQYFVHDVDDLHSLLASLSLVCRREQNRRSAPNLQMLDHKRSSDVRLSPPVGRHRRRLRGRELSPITANPNESEAGSTTAGSHTTHPVKTTTDSATTTAAAAVVVDMSGGGDDVGGRKRETVVFSHSGDRNGHTTTSTSPWSKAGTILAGVATLFVAYRTLRRGRR